MCAISGFVSNNVSIDTDLLFSLSRDMSSRGPDSSGFWTSSNLIAHLAHQRLSILDLTTNGNQPMHSYNKRFSIVFNGEVYNYKELKNELLLLGVVFKSNSDTEVILEYFNLFGVSTFSKIRGMFSIAIWDNFSNTLYLARDTFGIKPLYYYVNDEYLIFSSQVRPLNKILNKNISRNGIASYLLWGHVNSPNSIYEEIYSLKPGHYIRYHNNNIEYIKYYDLRDLYFASVNTDIVSVKTSLIESIKYHLISDQPVSLLLSSGIDSTALLSLAAEGGYKLNTFTLSFKEFKGSAFDESYYVNSIAKYYGSFHQNIFLDKDYFQQNKFRYFKDMDQPTIDGLNVWMISNFLKSFGIKVCLTGLGADEILFGYSTFKKIRLLSNTLNNFKFLKSKSKLNLMFFDYLSILFNKKIKDLPFFSSDITQIYYLVRAHFAYKELNQIVKYFNNLYGSAFIDIEFLNSYLEKELSSYKDDANDIQERLGTNFSISYLESKIYMQNRLLIDNDWASMQNGVELRTPFVDLKFYKNFINNQIYHKYNSKKEIFINDKFDIPDFILHRKKSGFEIPSSIWANLSSNMSSNFKFNRAISNLTHFL